MRNIVLMLSHILILLFIHFPMAFFFAFAFYWEKDAQKNDIFPIRFLCFRRLEIKKEQGKRCDGCEI